ncbi:MAG: hypothetical protein WCE98_02470 [Chlorobium sp.]
MMPAATTEPITPATLGAMACGGRLDGSPGAHRQVIVSWNA